MPNSEADETIIPHAMASSLIVWFGSESLNVTPRYVASIMPKILTETMRAPLSNNSLILCVYLELLY